jgi:hypothetical protein
MTAADNTGFLVQCARRLPALNFADPRSGRIYARLESGLLAWSDPDLLGRALQDAETRVGILAVAPNALDARPAYSGEARTIVRRHMLGR